MTIPDPTTVPSIKPIVVIANPNRLLDLLRLAVLRSDTVVAVTPEPDALTRRFIDAFAVELRSRPARPSDLEGADAALVALDNPAAENAIVRTARRRGVPIYVPGRTLVSDFTPLALMEQRPLSTAA